MELQNDVCTHGSAKLATFVYVTSGKVTQSGKIFKVIHSHSLPLSF